MTMRWRYPSEHDLPRARDRFDPVREGDRYRLSREVSIAIWERVCAEALDGSGRHDKERAQRRFHEIAAVVAARGGRLPVEIGRYTRVGVELGGMPLAAWDRELLARPAPGRETLVARDEAARAAGASTEAATQGRHEATSGGTWRDQGVERREDPRAGDVAQRMASLLRPASAEPPTVLDLLELFAARRSPGADSSAWSAGRDREPHDGRLPAVTRERMEQAYGQRFDDVEIHVDSPDVPGGQQAFTRGRHIYFERGAFDPDSEHGEHVIAHELAHVAQQARPARDGRPASRAALEDDAHQAALAALAGRAAAVNLFAPASAALAFSNGEEPRRPAGALDPGGRPPASTARGAGDAPSGGAAPGGGAAPDGGAAARGGASTSTGVPRGVPRGASTTNPGNDARPAAAPATPGASPASAPLPRRAAGDDLLMPEAPSGLTSGAAGRLQTIRTDNQGVAAATTDLPTAQQQTDVARAAVVEPQAEQDAHAQHDVVAAVDDRPPPSPEIEQACARIRQVIRDKRPPSEDKLVDAKPKEMAQAAGEEMSAGVEQRAGAVRQGYADMQQHPQGTPDTTPVSATIPPAQAQTPPVDAAAGAPYPLKHDDVSLDSDVTAQQQKIQDAGMNTEPGQLVKDGPIGDARGGVGDLQTMAKTDPQKVLADQAAAIAHAKGDMQALQAAAEKALADARAGTVAHMATHTTTVKGSEEQQRAAAGAQMQAIFTRTQQSVDTVLQPLSKNAVARWEAGVAQLSTDFESSLAEVKRKIDERHSGVGGWFVSGWDHLAGLPDWVTQDYDRAEARFGDGATGLITDISRDVNQVIEDCKKLIDQARKDIDAIVHSLPASLQTWAQGEANRLGQQLDQLSQRVDQAQKGLNQDLIHRANGAVQTVRERVADLREQAKGLLNKIADALVEFAKNPAKAIVDGLLRLLAIPPESFWALVDKLGNVISGIAADPMKFANTLMSGVGQGFKQFFHNLPVHLEQSIFQWLFSKMGDAGIQMPLDFTMPSIVTLIFEILGITWPRIKMILARHIGEKNVEVLDQAYQLIGTLIARGPLGVYHLILPHLDPGMIMDALKNAAISWLMQTIIEQVAMRIIMMLNPAGAILQAIEAIYRVIKWVIDNAARIFTLIEAVVNGAAQILAGNVSGVANLVERALGLLLVPVIDFLADFLHLSGIAEAIKKVIMGLQSKVEQILDKVIGFIVDKAKALWEAIKNKVKGKPKDGENQDGNPDAKASATEADKEAQGAAERGWEAARAATTSQVQSEAEVEAILSRTIVNGGHGAEVKLKLAKTAKSWSVEAQVQLQGSGATARAGNGWIATDPSGQPWYAATDQTAFNQEVIDEAYQAIIAKGAPAGGAGQSAEARYQAKVERARAAETKGQSQLDGKLHGLRFKIEMESFGDAERQHKIKTHFQIAPNTSDEDKSVPLEDDLSEAAAQTGTRVAEQAFNVAAACAGLKAAILPHLATHPGVREDIDQELSRAIGSDPAFRTTVDPARRQAMMTAATRGFDDFEPTTLDPTSGLAGDLRTELKKAVSEGGGATGSARHIQGLIKRGAGLSVIVREERSRAASSTTLLAGIRKELDAAMEELYSSHGVAGADRHDLGEYASMAAGDVIKQKLQAMDETALVQSLAADAEVRSALDQLCQTAWTAACDKWIESVLTQPWNPRRALIGWAKMAVYPKHLKGKSEADAQAKSNGGDAQYWPLDGYEDLVRDTLLNGQWGREGTTVHAYYDYGARIIGFDGGKPTGRHRAEITQGSPPEMHGHPRISW